MKLIRLGGIGLALAMLLNGNSAARADKEDPLEAYRKLSQPGPEHKLLEPMIGKWTWKGKFWMKPGDPLLSDGTAVRAWILDGRFMQDEIEAKGGLGDFKGRGVNGYDKIQKKYTSFWIDSMTTSFSTATGSADKDGKTFTYNREDVDPTSGEKIKGRDVIRILSQDEHVMEMFKVLPDGKEFKVMEITYKRAK